MSAAEDLFFDEDLQSLYAARDSLTAMLARTHAGAPRRINLCAIAKAERAPLFRRRDQVCALIHARRNEGRVG